MTDTWDYLTGFSNDPAGVPEGLVWARLRARRDAILAASDSRVGPDSSGDVDAWLSYRQALRDLPQVTADPRLAAWPDAPASTTPNPNRVAVKSAALDALQRNRDFIASTPTNTTTVAQVKDHARQLNGIIRLLLNRLDGTD